MTITDWVAVYAGIVATAALALELWRWLKSGPILSLSVIYPGEVVPSPEPESTYVFLTVNNRGNAPTTITNMIIYDYGNWLNRLRGKRTMQAVINNPSMSGPTFQPPYVLEVGRKWTGALIDKPEIATRIRTGLVYVGVSASHSNCDFLLRVRPPKEIPEKQID